MNWWVSVGVVVFILVSREIEPLKASFVLSLVAAILWGLLLGFVQRRIRKVKEEKQS